MVTAVLLQEAHSNQLDVSRFECGREISDRFCFLYKCKNEFTSPEICALPAARQMASVKTQNRGFPNYSENATARTDHLQPRIEL